jgi:hypothetical protein
MMELDVAERNETGYSVNKVCCCSELSFLWTTQLLSLDELGGEGRREDATV